MTLRGTSALAASAAIVVLAVLPPLVGPQKPQPEPSPAAAALTIELTGDEGTGDDPYTISFRGPADAPNQSVTVRDATGDHTGRIAPVTARCRPDAKPHAVFPEQEARWCLTLSDVAIGSELTGAVLGSKASRLDLTVHRRDAFVGWPLASIVAGIVAGVIAALVPIRLRRRVREVVLDRMVRDNKRDPNTKRRIRGLKAWVQTRRRHGDDDDTLIRAVAWATGAGVDDALAARSDLRTALQNSTAGDALPQGFADAARAAADAPVEIGELYDRDGERVSSPPANAWTDAVRQAVAIRDRLAELDAQIKQLPPDGARQVEAARAIARSRYDGLSSADDIPRADDALADLEDAVAAVRPAPTGPLLAANAPQRLADDVRRQLATLAPKPWSQQTLAGRIRWAWIATVLVLIVAVAYAIVTVKQATYDVDPLFHGFDACLTTFSAALGAGAAATVLSLLTAWTTSGGEDGQGA